MSSLNNPYLSFNLQNLLIRKNYKVIQSSSSKESLLLSYESSGQKPLITKSHNNKNAQSAIPATVISEKQKLRNPFLREILGERNENVYNPYTNSVSFCTQPYFQTLQQKKQLLFKQYNRPQITNRSGLGSSKSVSLPKAYYATSPNLKNINGLKKKKMQRKLLSQNTSTHYHPHFMSPSSKKNDWNTQRWKKQLQLIQRQKLQKYGPQGLRYDGKLLNGSNLNNQYYSTSSLEMDGYRIHVQKPSNKQRDIMFGLDQKQCKVKVNKQSIRYVSCNTNELSIMDDYKSIMMSSVNDNDEFQFMSRCEDKEDDNKSGPLDLRAFDSINPTKQESFYSIVNQRYMRESQPNKGLSVQKLVSRDTFGKKNNQSLNQQNQQQMVTKDRTKLYPSNNKSQTIGPKQNEQSSKQEMIKKDYPQQLSFNGKCFYRIKLVEDKNQ